MNMRKGFFFGICAVVFALMLTLLSPTGASAESGTWGDLSWALSEDGVLTVTGSGAMEPFPYLYEEDFIGPAPYAWREHLDRITRAVIGEGITNISQQAFADSPALKSVSLPDSLTSLDLSCFSACKALTSVTIPRNTVKIGEYVFADCIALTALVVDAGNPVFSSVDGVLMNKDQTRLIQYPFGRKDANYTVPSSVKIIGSNAFLKCAGLTGITFPNGLEEIENDAFYECENLTGVVFPASLKKTGSSAFNGCSSLKEITIPSGMESVSNSLFRNCSSLKHVRILEGPTAIQSGAFRGCDSLTWISIPKSVTSVYHYSFMGLTGLKNVYYAGTKEYWDEVVVLGIENDPLMNAKWHYGATRPAVSIAGAKIAAVGNQAWTGKKIVPAVKVTYKGTELAEGTDYTVACRNNKEVGVATVVVKGIGDYKGKVETTFKIVPQAVKILALKAGKQQLTLRWETNARAGGYEIEYSLKKDFTDSKKVKINKASVAEKVLGKLEAGKKYYVRIRAWQKAGGKKYFSAWSPVKAKKTK